MCIKKKKIEVFVVDPAGGGGGGGGGGPHTHPPPLTVPPLLIGIRCLKLPSKFGKDHSTVTLTILEAPIDYTTLLKN